MLKIMIVDDEALERQALKMVIGNTEYANVIAEASNGREAIEFNKKFNPDVIIMDVKMPGIDGIKASQIIKEEYPNKVIIMVTAYDDFELMRKALVLGVNDYILKPFKPDEISAIMKELFVNLKINEDCEEEINKDTIIFSESESIINPSIEYIEKSLNENITLEKMANLCNLSTCYFSKLFKREMGVNFTVYVNEKKVGKAKEMLENTNMPILNISLDLGFEDCGYFIRVFKKYEGVTPKKYREIIKTK